MVVVEKEGGQDGRGQEGLYQIVFLYADDGVLASSDPGWLQGAFNTLVGIFDQMGLQLNVGKTVVMVCCPCQESFTQSESAYEQ